MNMHIVQPDHPPEHRRYWGKCAMSNRGRTTFGYGRARSPLPRVGDFQAAYDKPPAPPVPTGSPRQIKFPISNVLVGRRQVDEAIAHFQKAVEIMPDNINVRRNLKVTLSQRQKTLKALAERRELLRSRPKDVTLLNGTAWLLATDPNACVRNGPEAIELAQRAIELSEGKRPEILATLAAAYAEAGQFAKALETARKALDLAKQHNQPAPAKAIQAMIRLYEVGAPFREPLQAPPQSR